MDKMIPREDVDKLVADLKEIALAWRSAGTPVSASSMIASEVLQDFQSKHGE